MKKIVFLTIAGILGSSVLFSQNYFRSGIFLHHSTGGYIWGPNPDGTSTKTIPGEMDRYNQENGYAGSAAVSMEEEWWSPGDNEWSTQHEFFEGNTTYTDINHYLSNYKILVVKSCFPSSAIENWGQPSDTNDPVYKTVYNYKWHWRHIVKVMKDNPQNFFAIWTNAPLEINSTNASEASFSKMFCRWAKDTLAAGLDPVFGPFPANVFVFDYFGKMADENGYELPQYVTGTGDSHPNGAGTDFVAPQFADEIFDAAIYYESHYNSVDQIQTGSRLTCFPSPVHSFVNFKLTPTAGGNMIISVIDLYGKEAGRIVSNVIPGREIIGKVNMQDYLAGIYFYRVSFGNEAFMGKIIKQ